MFWVLWWKIQTPTPGTQTNSCSPTQKKPQTNQPKIQTFIPVRSVIGVLHWDKTPFTSAEELNYKTTSWSIMALNDFLCCMSKKKKVSARYKYCFETLIPPDKSCVEESSYRVWMLFFSGGFGKFLHAEESGISVLTFHGGCVVSHSLEFLPYRIG